MTFDETSDLTNTCLRLRHGIEFEIRESASEVHCLITDEVKGEYYQVGLPEYALISLLDGRTSLHQAVSACASRLGDDAIDRQEAISIFHWLVNTGLAEPIDMTLQSVGALARIQSRGERQHHAVNLGRLNLLFMKLPLGDPESILSWITPRFSWITGHSFFSIWLAVCTMAVVCVFLSWDSLCGSASTVFDKDGWLWILASFVILKIVHELAHGIFCHHLGGRVKETGIVFILFVPLPYMDVTSCWGFPSKWKRIAVSAAGMYIECFAAAVAAITWYFTTDPTLRFHLFNIMLAGGVSTLLFNANFLMRFDGYYILTDIVEISNLYSRGQQFLARVGKRFLLGLEVEPVREFRSNRTLIATYAVAALIWRMLVCATLAIAASRLLYGFGLALAFVGVTIWFAIPVVSFVRFLFRDGIMQRRQWTRFAASSVVAVVTFVIVCVWVPWPQRVSAPAIVMHALPAVVRAETAGFVESIHVRDGDSVQSGDVIAILRNDQLMTRYASLRLDGQESILRGRGYHTAREIGPYQAELAARQSINVELAECKRQVDALTIRAPQSGTINANEIDSRFGSFLSRGETLAEIIDDAKKEILVAIDQHDFDPFDSGDDHSIRFYPNGTTSSVEGKLRAVDPTACTQIDLRLTASAGGPLSLRPKRGEPLDKENMAMELVRPRFRGWVDLSQSQSERLRAGTTGHVYLDRYSHSVGSHLQRLATEWFDAQLEKASLR